MVGMDNYFYYWLSIDKNSLEITFTMDDLKSFNISAEKLDSPITEFLRNKTIFLTGKSTFNIHGNEFVLRIHSVLNKKFLHLNSGGNGFVGKILIEKLLRCDVKKIFIMMRPKKQRNLHQRFEALTEDPVRCNIKGLFANDVYFRKRMIWVTSIKSSFNLKVWRHKWMAPKLKEHSLSYVL